MKNYVLIALVLTLVSCGDDDDETYFGGEIVNPKTNSVVLFKDGSPVDTAKLDSRNRFLFKFSSLESGLYYFYNQPEYQYIILEQGDSLLLRLNTYDFHESLVYSGKGAEKNNVLIAQFLQDKKDKQFIRRNLVELSPDGFKLRIDSMYASKLEKLDRFFENYHSTEITEDILINDAGYRLFRYAEIYPYLHYKYTNERSKKVPDNFYSFRELLDSKDDRYAHFDPYLRYLKLYVSGKAYDLAADIHKNYSAYEIIQSNEYHNEKLKIIEDQLKNYPLSKNKLLRNAAYTFYLDERRDASYDETYLENFKSYVSDTTAIFKEINEIHENLDNLKKGKRVKSINFINFSGNTINIQDTNHDKLTVYYFWARHQNNHFKDILNRVHVLEDKYPKINFVGINKDLNQDDWKKTLATYRLNPDNQYRINNYDSVSRKLMLSKMNKVLIINKDEIIVDAFADIYATNFETLLSSYRGNYYSRTSKN
ncbi:hypothetical protein SAMN05216480_106118 [Pustulibacterium marinum]|uniref:Thioredoxin-like fold domain-containing protein n=1 Tax=Pustulibacterium marinum TaxID=1224947 RepID=A0A1I7GZ18_9FLAO|nr:thioredoxin-like domain-containing protein [Pustulibacterium marinum]SFU53704.1 hypothetical protein SAMN05216480_106118 [Pustulibacterium marinum]